jgi:agmatinase
MIAKTDKVQAYQIILLGIPFDDNSSFMKGPAKAPPLIREALFSPASNLWSETGTNLGEKDLILDEGDMAFPRLDDALQRIEQTITDLNERELPVISLGGDHSITYPIIKAFRKKNPELDVLHLDAHPDLYGEFDRNRYSHACPFARIMEEELADRVVQVGIRTMNNHQKSQAKRFGMEVTSMDAWKDDFVFHFDRPLYISIDVDVLDPAFAPGVSHFEPGGMSTRQVINLLHHVQAPSLIGTDIVEFNPERDPTGLTAMVCAKLIKECAGLMLK